MGTIGTFLLSNALAPFSYGFNGVRFNTIRASVIGSQGWFWHVATHFGVKEDLVSLEGHFIIALYFSLTFYFWVITVVVTAIFIGKMI